MNYDKKWDVIVVGAGPGGSKTAEEFAKRGAKTLVVEKKQQIGPPKRCGEGLSQRWMEIANLDPDPTWTLQKITGTVLVAPNGEEAWIDTEDKDQAGYIIERSKFEKDLASDAIRAGSKFMLKARAADLVKENGKIAGVKVVREGKPITLKSDIVVGADGVDSMIARKAGLNSTLPLSECDSGYQYEMTGVDLKDPHKMELYFGSEAANRGYVWIFPKGSDIANVGVGITGEDEKTAKHYLDRWMKHNQERFKNASITEINSGVVPVTSPIDQMVSHGLMLVGDSARMVNPMHGGGIGPALEAGIMAAEIGVPALEKGAEKQFLQPYQEKWEEKRGKNFKKILKVRHFFEKLSDKHLNLIAENADPDVLLNLGHRKSLSKIAKTLLKSSPQSIGFVKDYITK